VEYETFGNITKLPEADAEGHALTSTYYLDNQIATEKQNEETVEYVYDPDGRTLETQSKGKTTATAISHYSGPGEALTWSSEEEGKKWSRDIPGIDGALDAIEKSGEETKPVLQLHDLQGNIVGTAADSETETKLISTYNSTEFGVPNEGKAPPKYAWLGASGVTSETTFGTGVSTEGGMSYVPQIARNLQTAPVVPPGAFPNGQGTGSQKDSEIPGWYITLSNQESAATIAEYTAKQESVSVEVEDPWYMTMSYQEIWAIIGKLKSMISSDDLHEFVLSQAPVVGPIIDFSWNTYEALVLVPFLDSLETDAKRMEVEYKAGRVHLGFFIEYKLQKVYLPGPKTLLTGEDETLYVPYNLGVERCKYEGSYGYELFVEQDEVTSYYSCPKAERTAVGWPYD
jgi:YD repeat-containing protein